MVNGTRGRGRGTAERNEATGAKRSSKEKISATAAQRALIGFGSLRNSISVQATRAHYRLKKAHGFKLVKGSGPRVLKSERNPRLVLELDFHFDKKYKMSFPIVEN